MNKLFKILSFFVLILLLGACTSSKRLPFKSASLEPLTINNLVEKISKTGNSERLIQISRFTAEYSGITEQNSFKGYARLKQDSLIMLSMSPMVGGEAYRTLLSPTESKIINRFDETYSISQYHTSEQIIPLPFNLLQAVLSYQFSPIVNNSHTLDVQDMMYVVEDKSQTDIYTAIKVDSKFMVRHFFYKDIPHNTSVYITYSTFTELNDKLFPENIEVTISGKNEVAILRLSIKRVETKEELSFPFNVNPDFTRVY